MSVLVMVMVIIYFVVSLATLAFFVNDSIQLKKGPADSEYYYTTNDWFLVFLITILWLPGAVMLLSYGVLYTLYAKFIKKIETTRDTND